MIYEIKIKQKHGNGYSWLPQKRQSSISSIRWKVWRHPLSDGQLQGYHYSQYVLNFCST